MNTFDQILELFKTSSASTLKVKDKEREIKGAALFRTINMLDDPGYIKIAFSDGAILLMIMNGKLFYFDEKPPKEIKDFKTSDIGKVEEIEFNKVKYKLANPLDYQFVQQLLVGSILDVEGEVMFSDYMDDNENMLSLGVDMRTGARSDVNPSLISEDDVDIVL